MEEKKFLSKSGLDKLIAKIEEMFAFKSHNHSKSDITDFPTSMKNPTSLTIQFNGTTNSSYDGSTQQTINITPSSIGASESIHDHDGRYYTESEIDAKLNTKANSTHDHDNTYYTESEIDTMLSAKSDNTHDHNASDITDLTVTATELNYMDGVTSNVQSQLDNKQDTITGGISNIVSNNLVENRVLTSDINGKVSVSKVTSVELDYLYGVTSSIQDQINGKAASSHEHSATNITSGILSADRLPSIPVNKLDGIIDASNLPSYVDDVLEYNTLSSFPETGENGKIYIDIETNKTYRWSGSTYVEISESLALGVTSSTAFRGDFGNSAYAHAITNKGSAFASGLYKITTNSEGHVTGATDVVKSDITGLGIPGEDTNNAVTQTNDITTDTDYRIILSNSANDETETQGVNKNSNFTYNPSTKTLSVTKVKMGSATMSYDSTAGAVVISFS